MNKTVKRKFIGAIMSIFLGIFVLIYVKFNYNSINENLLSYLIGFSCGIMFVAVVLLFKVIRAINNPQKSKELENLEKDERIKMISNNAMAITLKLTLIMESAISLICAFTGKMEISECIGYIISTQLILYLIIYFYMQNKN